EHLLGMATRGIKRKMRDVVRLIDSTSLHLAGIGAEWARFSAEGGMGQTGRHVFPRKVAAKCKSN
ncbi:MAG: hypothetical protein ACREDL_08400, partial [Bradyrhizobium sp.]